MDRRTATALRFLAVGAGEAAVTAGPDDAMAAGMAGRGHLRASRADHEHVIDTLKAAFVQGRLTKDELDERVGQTFAARTYAELAAVTVDIPVRQTAGQSPSRHSRARARWPVSTSVNTGARTVLVLTMLAALISIPVAVLAGKTGDSALTSTSPDTQACRIFNSWTGPASPDRAWLLDAAVTAAKRGSDRNLLGDLETLQHLVRQFGDSAAQWPPGAVQDSAQDQVGIASVSVGADCMAYNY
jgi:hypothetical protein